MLGSPAGAAKGNMRDTDLHHAAVAASVTLVTIFGLGGSPFGAFVACIMASLTAFALGTGHGYVFAAMCGLPVGLYSLLFAKFFVLF